MPWIIKREEDDTAAELRSRYSDEWSLMNLSADVLDAIEKFNEVGVTEKEVVKTKKAV